MVLVWSEARIAEGEKGESCSCLKHTPVALRVPADSLFNMSRSAQTEQVQKVLALSHAVG
jgi:hypothetical protein